MELKAIKIGNIETKNNVFFAPLAGFSTAEMRLICEELGAGLTVSEMVSAKGLIMSPGSADDLIFSYPQQSIIDIQLFGNDPYYLSETVKRDELQNVQIFDLNMGCPVPKIFNNGEGSALLENLPLAAKCIEAISKQNKVVTVKFRIGIDKDHIVTREFAKMCEDSGASLITIHGRTKDSFYSGDVYFEEIQKAKSVVNIPVIANGGVFTTQDADKLMSNTGADGIMVARGALENPLIFSEITKQDSKVNLKDIMLSHLDMSYNRFGDRAAILLRKSIAYYLKGIRNGKKLKQEIFTIDNVKELKQVINRMEIL